MNFSGSHHALRLGVVAATAAGRGESCYPRTTGDGACRGRRTESRSGPAARQSGCSAASGRKLDSASRRIEIVGRHASGETHGLVLTLGRALFSRGRADLEPGASGNLGRLVTFLDRYPDRTVVINGYTDSVGYEDYRSRRRIAGSRSEENRSFRRSMSWHRRRGGTWCQPNVQFRRADGDPRVLTGIGYAYDQV